MRKLAEKFWISDLGLAKLCRCHEIPVPGVGYWRKKETAIEKERGPLPKTKDGQEFIVIEVHEKLHPEQPHARPR